MRRLNRDDDGITAVVVTLAMTVLILIAALALDMGTGFFNRARAQNSADAQALAAAINCASGEAIDATPLPALQTGESVSLNIALCSGHNEVTATVSKSQDFQFIPGSVTIDRPATAVWGTIGSASTALFTITECEYSLALLNNTTSLQFNLEDHRVHASCPGGSTAPPGGFGWIDHISGTCKTLPVSPSGTIGSDTGATSNKDREDCLDAAIASGEPLLIPISNAVIGAGGTAEYVVVGFAQFKVTDYSFKNDCGADADGKKFKACIFGDIVPGIVPQLPPGGGTPFGTYIVYLTK